MADKDAMLRKLNSMSQSDLQRAVIDSAKKIGAAKQQLKQKDKLIADFTSQKEKTKREAEKIIAAAKEQARSITEDAEKKEAQARHRIEEADAEVSRKLTNANAEADSIVESRLAEAKSEIEKIENRREEAKRSAIALNKNIIERYDTLITEVEEQISRFRDMQESINSFNVEIEAEDFKKFDMSDYVTTTPKPAKKSKAVSEEIIEVAKPILDVDNDDTEIDDEELAALAFVFDEDEDFDDESEEEEIPDLEESELITEADLAFLEEDFDFNDISGFKDVVAEDIEEDDDDIFANGKMKSFTDSFMAVRATDDDDDLGDIDIDSILDDDDDEEPVPAPKVTVPARRHRRSNRSHPGQWLPN